MDDYDDEGGEIEEPQEIEEEGFQEEEDGEEEEGEEEKEEELEEEETDEFLEGGTINMMLPPEKSFKIVSKDQRSSSKLMTKFEFVNLISTRAKQINSGDSIFVEGYTGKMDSVSIARYEIKNRKIPAIIRRFLPGKKIEIWDINEMIIDPGF